MQETARRPDAPAPYAGYDVLAKWDTPSYNDVTRRVLADRLHDIPPRRFFTPEAYALLEAIVERLAPPLPDLCPRLLASWIDDRLYRNLGEGFRGVDAPSFQQSWRIGIAAIDGEARRLCHAPFAALTPEDRDRTLRAIQAGDTDPAVWPDLEATSFFSDALLKMTAGLAYAHPAGWNDIGFGGPASPRGYVRLGFDSRDPWEAEARR